jgi:hyaluronoglucosaminidase
VVLNMAITPNGKKLYVANILQDTLTPVRLATRTASKPVPLGTPPFGLAVTPDSKTVYVAAGGVVVPIRTATNTALKPINIGGIATGAFAIVITPNGTMAYTANGNNGTVTPIRIATNTALRPIRAGTRPEAIAITPTLSTLCRNCV